MCFFYFLAHNPHKEQSKRFWQYLITSSQFLVLRELVVNDMAQNLPEYRKKKLSLCKTLKSYLQCFASGKFKKKNPHYIICMLFKKYWHWTDLNIMSFVTKLVLVPMEEWKKIVRDQKDVNKMKTVDISIQRGQGEAASDSPASWENQKLAKAPCPPPPLREKGRRKRKKGEGKKYVDR